MSCFFVTVVIRQAGLILLNIEPGAEPMREKSEQLKKMRKTETTEKRRVQLRGALSVVSFFFSGSVVQRRQQKTAWPCPELRATAYHTGQSDFFFG